VSDLPLSPTASSPAIEAWVEEQLRLVRDTLRLTMDRVQLRHPELTARRLSRHLNRNPNYLYKMLAGFTGLKVEEVCRVLTLLAVVPHDFFFSIYPLGGMLAGRLRDTQVGGAVPLDGPDVGIWVRYPELPLLAGVDRRASQVLRAKIREAGHTQWELSEALGYRSRHALGLALRQRTTLTFRHVFEVLGFLSYSPDLFFAEVFGPDEGLWAAGTEWAAFRKRLLELHRQSLVGMAERRPSLGLHPPVDPEE